MNIPVLLRPVINSGRNTTNYKESVFCNIHHKYMPGYSKTYMPCICSLYCCIQLLHSEVSVRCSSVLAFCWFIIRLLDIFIIVLHLQL